MKRLISNFKEKIEETDFLNRTCLYLAAEFGRLF